MWIVLFVIMLDIIGFGIIGPVFPFYLKQLGAGPEMVGFYLALFTAALFISTPILGRLSDRYGRKPIMIFGVLGSVIGYLLLAVADSLLVVALARILSGLMAGNFGAAQAYIIDSSREQDRAKFMGYFGATMGLGFVIGPAIGAALGGDSFENANFVLPALTAAVLSSCALIGVVFFVKESLPPEQRSQHQSQAALGFFKSVREIFNRRLLVLLIACGALYQIASGLFEPIFPLWVADYAIVDGPRGMTWMLLLSGLVMILIQSFGIVPLTRRFSERRLLQSGALGMAVCAYLITLAGNAASVIAVTALVSIMYGFAGIVITCAQTLVSRCAAPHERGMVMGVYSSVNTLGRTITTLFSGVIYGQLHFHAPYYGAAILFLLMCWIGGHLPAKNK